MKKNKYMLAGLLMFGVAMGFSGPAMGQNRIPAQAKPVVDDGVGPRENVGAKVASGTFAAQSTDGQTLYFRIINNGNTVALTYPNDTTNSALNVWGGYTKPTGNLIVPSTVTNNGTTYSVVSCDCAFGGCTGLTSVTFPNTITSLGYNMFYGCSSLTSVNLPSGLTSIGSHAFHNCAALTTVTIPSTVQNIYDWSFARCQSLTNITLPNSLKWIDQCAFYDDSSLTAITIPDSVTIISGWAFYGCRALQSLQLGSSVQMIDTSAFGWCLALTSTTLPTGLRKIGKWAFVETGLTGITIPASVALVEDKAFAWSESLATVNWNAEKCHVGDSVFAECAPQSTLTIGADVAYITDTAFDNAPFTTVNYNARNLKMADVSFYFTRTWNSSYHQYDTVWDYDSVVVRNVNDKYLNLFKNVPATTVTVSESVERMSGGVFAGTNVSTVNWNCSISSVYSYSYSYVRTPFVDIYSFYDDETENWILDSTIAPITTLNFGNSVQTIPEGLMYNISTLNQTTIPASVVEIGAYAFAYSGLNGEITIPASVERFGENVFEGTNLTTVNYNAAHAKIGEYREQYVWNDDYDDYVYDYVWQNVETPIFGNVANFNIGSTVDSIPAYLLYGDSALTTLTVPVNVRYVGNRAFACPNLTTLNWNARRANYTTNSNSSIQMFQGNSQYVSGHYVYTNAAYISNLTIGDQVQYIPNGFLQYDTMLVSVTFPASVKSIGRYAFKDTKLTSVTIPATLDTLGYGSFQTKGTLTQITYLPANLFYDGSEYAAFSFIYNDYNDERPTTPQTLTLGSGVRSIPNYIFRNMNITSLALPDSLQSIGNYSFAYCNQLTSVTVPDLVTSIGNRAFRDCTAMQTATIGNGVTAIGNHAFNGCPITRLTLGESLASIGERAFEGMVQVDTIFVRATVPPTITSNTFQGMPTNARIMLPCGTLQTYEDAPYWNNFTRMAEPPECGNIITVLANNPAMGTVTGGGSYSTGTVATLSAMPKVNHGFAGWADGSVDNPRLVMVSGDASYTANFVAIGGGVVHDTTVVTVHDTIAIHDTLVVGDGDTIVIYRDVHDTVYIHDTVYVGVDEVEMVDVKLYSNGGQVIVEGVEGQQVMLYDAVGRVLAVKHDEYGTLRFDIPVSGTYLVKVGNTPARRIVVMR